MRLPIRFAFIIICFFCFPAWAEENNVSEKLESATEQLQKVQKDIALTESQKKKLEKEILNLRRQTLRISKKIRQLDKNLKRERKEIDYIAIRLKSFKEQLEAHKSDVKAIVHFAQFRTVYDENAAIFMNHDELWQQKILFRHFFKYHKNQYEKLKPLIEKYTKLHDEHREAQEKLNRTKSSLDKEQKKLVNLSNKRKKKNARLRVDLKSKQNLTANLSKDIKTYEALMQKMMETSTETIILGKGQGKFIIPLMGQVELKSKKDPKLGLMIRKTNTDMIVAPYDGVIKYAGDFRTFGQTLIIHHGEGYHSVLIGLSSIDVNIGDSVFAGEPVGLLKGNEGQLLFEIRQNGQLVSVQPWLSSNLQNKG